MEVQGGFKDDPPDGAMSAHTVWHLSALIL